jgi:hypothetical protein
MDRVHQHEDTMIVEGPGGLYRDTPDNCALDFGVSLQAIALPNTPGLDERLYQPGIRHAIIANDNVVAGGPMPWPLGDQMIGDVMNALAAQAARKPPPPAQSPVISRTQALIALQRTNKLTAVKAAVAQDPENQIWFDTAPTWHRDNPRIAALAPAVGLTSKDLDDLFALAKTITD